MESSKAGLRLKKRRAKKTMEVEEATQTPACCNKLTTLELIMAVKILTCIQEVVSLFL